MKKVLYILIIIILLFIFLGCALTIKSKNFEEKTIFISQDNIKHPYIILKIERIYNDYSLNKSLLELNRKIDKIGKNIGANGAIVRYYNNLENDYYDFADVTFVKIKYN